MEQTILLVDDENHFRERLGRALTKRGYNVTEAANYEEAMTWFTKIIDGNNA